MSYSEKEAFVENASKHLQVPPLGAAGGSWPLIAPNVQTFQPEDAGWLSWERLPYS